MLEKQKIKCFVYQSGAFSKTPKGTGENPMMAQIMRYIAGALMGILPMCHDNQTVGELLLSQDKVKVVVMRPGALKEAEDGAKVEASNTMSMSPITFKELADLLLRAMKNESLYGTSPLVALVSSE